MTYPSFLKKAWQKLLGIRHNAPNALCWSKSTIILWYSQKIYRKRLAKTFVYLGIVLVLYTAQCNYPLQSFER